MEKELKAFQRKLTNLTSNNKSLVQLRLSKTQDVDINEFDFLNVESSFGVIDFLLSSKRKYDLCAVVDSRNSAVNEQSLRLKKIHRNTSFLLEERGVKELYIGWPYVVGKLGEGNSVRCPLLFFPIELEVKEDVWRLVKRSDEPITFNKSFLLAYSYFNKIALSNEFVEHVFEENGDAQEFRNDLYKLLKVSNLDINFNSELFENKLKHFKSYKRDEFDFEFKNGIIRLENQAVLGMFPQAGSYLVPDYDYWIENSVFETIEDFFLSKSLLSDDQQHDRYRFLKQVKEEHTFTPFKIDASQENALKAVKKGNSLVVQGPPGTGKSQLISNLIADFMARGKNVLVVCQKRVALDVVYDRLKEKDLGEFVGVVHDFKNDRKRIYEQIHKQIESIPNYQKLNNGLDTIYLEREYLQNCRRIDQITEELEEYRTILFDTKECDISVKELYLLSNKGAEKVNLNLEFKQFNREKINSFLATLDWLVPYAIQFDDIDFEWSNRLDFSEFSISDLSTIQEVIKNVPFYQNDFSSKIESLLGDKISIEESKWILDRKQHILNLIELIQHKKVYEYFKFLIQKSNVDGDWLILKENQVLACFKGKGVETSLSNEELVECQSIILTYKKTKNHLFKRINWWLFNKDKYKLKRVLVANQLEWNTKGIEDIVQRIDNRFNLQHFITELEECTWLTEVPNTFDLEEIKNWFHRFHVAVEAKQMAEETRNFVKYIPFQQLSYQEIKERVEQALKWSEVAASQLFEWSRFLSQQQIAQLLEKNELAESLRESLDENFDNLCFYDKAKKALELHEIEVLKKLLEKSKSKEDAQALFKESIYYTWIEFLETKHPNLREVSTLKFDQLEKELQLCIKNKLRLSKDILLLKIREQTFRDVEYNRLNNMVTYRELGHQVSKKRKIWPIRKLVEEFSEELFDVVPCWMASPESVSAIFPMSMQFDLVIFDEASQCFSEKGLPAIYRAKQVVVTGDKHQLSPNDLYQIRFEEEEEVSSDLEIDSLLDLSSKYLMQVQLNGHYRSQSLDLIDFSNQHFYNNELRLLPSFEQINSNKVGIEYIKINGRWENGVNPIEANMVVDLLIENIQNGNDDIGVVTFNYKQQNHIMDTLEERAVQLKLNVPPTVFVKNIENVQGDERGTIIFSVGYAENSQGKMNMHFGSINMEKGENRLNVAITRAKYKVIVVASIMPNQLNVEEAKHNGPRLFKSYLEYAFKVSEGSFVPGVKHIPSLSNEWYLNSKLIGDLKDDFECTTTLPFADIALKEKGVFKGLVLTDDNSYFTSLSAKDYHGYLQLSLKERKWPYYLMNSRNYWLNAEKERAKVKNKFSE